MSKVSDESAFQLCMGLCRRIPVKVLMLLLVHCLKCLQCSRKHQMSANDSEMEISGKRRPGLINHAFFYHVDNEVYMFFAYLGKTWQ